MGIIKPNCKVLRHEATIEISQGAGSFTYFTDLTENHYKAMIFVDITTQTGEIATGQLIVTPRTGTDTIVNFVDTTVIQIEDARSVALNSTSSGVVLGQLTIIKDFCICCPGGEVHRHEGTFRARGDFLFTDLTENHYKAMFIILGNGSSLSTTAQVVVTPRVGTPTTIPLQPREQAIIQVEDAQSVFVDNLRFSPEGGVFNDIQIIKDFCISCP